MKKDKSVKDIVCIIISVLTIVCSLLGALNVIPEVQSYINCIDGDFCTSPVMMFGAPALLYYILALIFFVVLLAAFVGRNKKVSKICIAAIVAFLLAFVVGLVCLVLAILAT